jgi:hypothetical protein
MNPLIIGATNLDADQLIFFKRQLEFVKSRSYDVKYPTLQATSVFPVSTEAGPGAESIVYEQFDTVGLMKFISDYADDLPRSDVKGKQYSILIQSLGGSYGWSLQEVRASQMAKRNINGMRAMAARRSNDQMVNKIGWFADGTAAWAGLTGILYHPNITKVAATTGTWSSATSAQIVADVNNAINSVVAITKGVEAVDTCLIPTSQFALIASTQNSTASDTTILEFLRRVHPGVTFAAVNELGSVSPNPRTASATATNCMLCYRRSPDHLQFEIPVIYEQFAAQERNLAFVVPCHSRNAGFNVYYPLSVVLVDGI